MSDSEPGGGLEFQPEFFLITFSSASHCIEAEKKAKERYQVHIIPTPREITASCGMALRFAGADCQSAQGFFRELDVPSQLYVMGFRSEDGRRPAKKLGENAAQYAQ